MTDEEKEAKTTELQAEFTNIITSMKESIDHELTRLTDEGDTEGLALWQAFQTEVLAAEAAGYPAEIPSSQPRRKSDNSGWLTIDSQGEAPDVI